MIKILQSFDQMNRAGTEKAILNILNSVDRNKVQFELLVQKEGELDQEIRNLGINIHYVPRKNRKNFFSALEVFFAENGPYTAIHVHSNGNMGYILKAAKNAGIKHRIIHSHNSRSDLPCVAKLYKILKGIKTGIIRNSTQLFACSLVAAKWLFPLKWKKCKIIDNAINIDDYVFNENNRINKRKELGLLPSDKVILHIGRFSKQKNHIRLIELANKMTSLDNNIKFLLVGNGELFEQIKGIANSENIMFLGIRQDVPDLLNASDLFFLPSLYEGLPFVLVEAQVNGLQVITSTNVSAESDIGSGLLTRISLEENDEVWIDSINRKFKTYDRTAKSYLAYNSKYDIKRLGKELEDFYLTLI